MGGSAAQRSRGFNLELSNLICFSWITLSIIGTDALQVSMSKTPIKLLVNQDVTIPCTISGSSTPELNLQNVAIHWLRVSPDGKTQDVYEFNTGVDKSTRKGSKISERELIKGNAELYIPRMQFSDEGDYKCIVFVTPSKAEGISRVEVSALPTSKVTPPKVVVEIGTEKTVMCEVDMFYPQPVKIRWVQYHKTTFSCVALEKATCTGSPVGNADGTFNVTSHLTLNPSFQDDGNVYWCIVQHTSFVGELVHNFTLTVKEREEDIKTIIGVVIGTIISVSVIGRVVFWVYNKYLKKVPPKITEITGNERMVHMSTATLSCQITGFRPAPIEVILYVKRANGNKELIQSWKPRNTQRPAKTFTTPTSRNNGGDYRIVTEPGEAHPLSDADTLVNTPLLQTMRLEMTGDVKSNADGTSNCLCTIHLTPNLEDDDHNAVLSVCIKHEALKEPITVERQLEVIGVAPKLSTILTPMRIIHEEPLTLTCYITGFKPRPLSITWAKTDLSDQEIELVKCDSNEPTVENSKYSHNLSETTHEDQSFSILSVLTLKPKINEDHGATYICRTFHSATGERAGETMKMSVSAIPKLDPIQNTQDVLYVGDKIELTCKIHSFHPQRLHVHWYKDNELLPSNEDEVLGEANGLFHLTSRLTCAAQVKDFGKKFRCEVHHQTLTEPMNETWEFKNLISTPKITAIRCEPDVPECNKPVQLSCTVKDYYPKPCIARWYRGVECIFTESETEDIQQDKESGLFYRTIHRPFTPTAKDHAMELRVEVTHCKKRISKSYFMTLKGLPKVKDITCDKEQPKYGEPLTLCCNVEGCTSHDVQAEWLENNIQVKRSMTASQTNTDKGLMSYLLQLTPTGEDYAQCFTCSLKHRDMPEPIKKNIYLKLPDKSPTLSEITVDPEKPQFNKEACFKIIISGFAPKDIQVKWFRAFTILSEKIELSTPQIQKDGLYSCSSIMRYTPKEIDHDVSIRCEVVHTVSRKLQGKQYTLNLKGTVTKSGDADKRLNYGKETQKPQMTRIECLTTNPKMGEDVTLTCFIQGWDVKDGGFSWYNGMFPIDEDRIQNANQKDPSGCISTVTVTPEKSDRECKIKFEATFNFETLEETYVVRLV